MFIRGPNSPDERREIRRETPRGVGSTYEGETMNATWQELFDLALQGRLAEALAELDRIAAEDSNP